MLKNGSLRWYMLKDEQLKNEYRDSCIIIKILDDNLEYEKWDTKIKISNLVINKFTVWLIDNENEIHTVPLDKLSLYKLDKKRKKIMVKNLSLMIDKYFTSPLSLKKTIKILNKNFLNIKKLEMEETDEFYIGYLIQCEPV